MLEEKYGQKKRVQFHLEKHEHCSPILFELIYSPKLQFSCQVLDFELKFISFQKLNLKVIH